MVDNNGKTIHRNTKFNKIKITINYIFFDYREFSLENRLLISAIIIGIFISLLGSVVSIIISSSTTVIIISLSLLFMLILFYYFVRIKKKFNLFVFPIIVFSIIGISIIWIFDGGINGANLFPGIVILILSLIVVPDNNKKYVISLFIASVIIIYLIQLYRPDLVVNFSSDKVRWIDSIITVIYSSFLIFIIIKFLHKNYTLEKQRAEESEAKYRTIIEHSGDAIAIRQKGKFEFANKAFSKMLDYSIIELIGIENSLIFDSDILNDMEKRISKNDLNENLSIQFETMITKKDKTKIDVEIFEKIISYKKEKAQLIIVRDITKQKAIMKDLQRGAEQTKGLNKFIPICAGCYLISDEKKENKPWVKPADYISERLPEIQFSHGICPDCMKKLYPEIDFDEK